MKRAATTTARTNGSGVDGASGAVPVSQAEVLSRPSAPERLTDMSILLGELPPSEDGEEILDSVDWIFAEQAGYPSDGMPAFELPRTPSSSTPWLMLEQVETPTRPPLPPLPPAPSALIHVASESHFSTLSRINSELHSFSAKMRGRYDQGRFASLVLERLDVKGSGSSAKRPDLILVRLSQDYLQVIKSLHRSLGTDVAAVPPWVTESTGQTSVDTSIDPSLVSPATVGQSDGSPRGLAALDAPTAFLLISCFTQLVEGYEAFLTIAANYVGQPTGHISAPPTEYFAGIPIAEFLTESAVLLELARNLFGQIIIVLGLPVVSWWKGKSIWTGLLADQRHRDLLNRELGGAMEGGWSTRPAKVMMTIEMCKAMVNDCSMMGL
jgi:hypothetical protein